MKYRLTPGDEETLAFLREEEISSVLGFAERYHRASAALREAADSAVFYAVFFELRESARFGIAGDDTLDFRIVNGVLRQLNLDIDTGRLVVPGPEEGKAESLRCSNSSLPRAYSPLGNLN